MRTPFHFLRKCQKKNLSLIFNLMMCIQRRESFYVITNTMPTTRRKKLHQTKRFLFIKVMLSTWFFLFFGFFIFEEKKNWLYFHLFVFLLFSANAQRIRRSVKVAFGPLFTLRLIPCNDKNKKHLFFLYFVFFHLVSVSIY